MTDFMQFLLSRGGCVGRQLRVIGAAATCAAMVVSSVSAQEASLEAPETVAPQAEFSVSWHGPDALGDFIALAEPAAATTSFIAYARTSSGNPVSLIAPEPGDYELRYVSAATMTLLTTTALRVDKARAAAMIWAPTETDAGAPITVTLAVPVEPADYVTIVEEGAPDTAFGPYARLHGATEIELTAPEEAGMYEIRLVRARDQTVLVRTSLTVVLPRKEAEAMAPSGPAEPTTAGAAISISVPPAEPAEPAMAAATLMALAAVDRAAPFRVAWTGPAAPGDRIEIVPKGGGQAGIATEVDATAVRAALTAPTEAGLYRIRYVAGDGSVLADRALEVK